MIVLTNLLGKFPMFAPNKTRFWDIRCRVEIEKVFWKLQNWDIKFATSRNTFCDSKFHRRLSSVTKSACLESQQLVMHYTTRSLPNSNFRTRFYDLSTSSWVNCKTWTKCEFNFIKAYFLSQFVKRALLDLSKSD